MSWLTLRIQGRPGINFQLCYAIARRKINYVIYRGGEGISDCWRLARRSKIVGFRKATCRSIRTISSPTSASARDNGVALEPIADIVRKLVRQALCLLRGSASDLATAQGHGPDAAVDSAKGHQQSSQGSAEDGPSLFTSARPHAKERGSSECIRKTIMHTSGVKCFAKEPQGLNS